MWTGLWLSLWKQLPVLFWEPTWSPNRPVHEETRRRQTRLSHTFHTHSFSETKAGKFRFAFTPRNTQNTHGPLVRPLKPADMFFVCTQIVPHSQMQPPPRRSLAQGQTQIHTYWSPSVHFVFWQMSKNAAGEMNGSVLDCGRLNGDNDFFFFFFKKFNCHLCCNAHLFWSAELLLY